MIGTIRLALFAALALAGCSTSEPYPRESTDIGESADYPLAAASFRRTGIFELSADKPDFAIHYRLCQFDSVPYLEIVSAIRITRVSGTAESVKSRFDAAKVEQSRFGGELLAEGSLVLTKQGKKYSALTAAYSTEGHSSCIVGVILGPPQPRYVELIAWRHEDRIISLESSARLDNRDIASEKNMELLDAVNWTVLPF